jgi:choline kinase
VVILAAGMGTRLGRPLPKPLTQLADGRTIIGQQIDNVREAFDDAEILVVVGFKLEQIMEAVPDVAFAYNENYDQTNTSKSLLKALRATGPRGVLWMNGDVVFDPAVLKRVEPMVRAGTSFVCVDTAAVGDEEVKYTVDDDGCILQLSKTVEGGLGEAVGINHISAADKELLIDQLERVGENDYFERGIELGIEQAGLRILPVDISDLFAVEVDFEADLDRVNEHL